jgi:hypothetical protein
VDLENSNFLGTLVPEAGTRVSELIPDSGLVVFAVLLLVATSCEGGSIEGCASLNSVKAGYSISQMKILNLFLFLELLLE